MPLTHHSLDSPLWKITMAKRKRRNLTDTSVRITIGSITFDRPRTRAEQDDNYRPVKRVKRLEPLNIDIDELMRLARVELARDHDSIPDKLAERLLMLPTADLLAYFTRSQLSPAAKAVLLNQMAKLHEEG